MSHIGKILVEIRGSESQSAFAASLDVSNVTILNYEKGHRLPDIDFLVKVAKTQHVNLSELIDARIKDSPVADKELLCALPVLKEQAVQDLKIAAVMRRKLEEMKATEAGLGNGSSDPTPQPDDRLEMLQMVLRISEMQLTTPPPPDVAKKVIDLADAWSPFAAKFPDLKERLDTLKATASFFI